MCVGESGGDKDGVGWRRGIRMRGERVAERERDGVGDRVRWGRVGWSRGIGIEWGGVK